ncbi:hypothetical protein E2320_010924 [Naja naja]|nr:hypothetical protein E2320_010924 [Naja naja]
MQGHYTNKILTCIGIRQGCILAPLLFNFYIHPLVAQLIQLEHHSPKLANRHIASLLYVDDILLLSGTQIGLKTNLECFGYGVVRCLHGPYFHPPKAGVAALPCSSMQMLLQFFLEHQQASKEL